MSETSNEPFEGGVIDSLPARVITMNEEQYSETSKRLEDAGFRNLSWLQGVNGKQMKSVITGDRTMITYRAEYEIDVAQYREAHSSMPSWGGVGCYLSHAKAWEEAMKTPHGLFVFEADAHPSGSDAFEKTKKALEQYSRANNGQPPDFLFLGGFGFPESASVPGVPDLQVLKSRLCGLEGYYISPQGARRLLKNAYPIEVQVDSYISYVMRDPEAGEGFTAFVLTERTMHQENQDGTSIQTKEVRDDLGMDDPMIRIIKYILIGVAVIMFLMALNEARRLSKGS